MALGAIPAVFVTDQRFQFDFEASSQVSLGGSLVFKEGQDSVFEIIPKGRSGTPRVIFQSIDGEKISLEVRQRGFGSSTLYELHHPKTREPLALYTQRAVSGRTNDLFFGKSEDFKIETKGRYAGIFNPSELPPLNLEVRARNSFLESLPYKLRKPYQIASIANRSEVTELLEKLAFIWPNLTKAEKNRLVRIVEEGTRLNFQKIAHHDPLGALQFGFEYLCEELDLDPSLPFQSIPREGVSKLHVSWAIPGRVCYFQTRTLWEDFENTVARITRRYGGTFVELAPLEDGLVEGLEIIPGKREHVNGFFEIFFKRTKLAGSVLGVLFLSLSLEEIWTYLHEGEVKKATLAVAGFVLDQKIPFASLALQKMDGWIEGEQNGESSAFA